MAQPTSEEAPDPQGPCGARAPETHFCPPVGRHQPWDPQSCPPAGQPEPWGQSHPLVGPHQRPRMQLYLPVGRAPLGPGPTCQQASTRSWDTGPTTTHPRAWLCPPEGQSYPWDTPGPHSQLPVTWPLQTMANSLPTRQDLLTRLPGTIKACWTIHSSHPTTAEGPTPPT